MLNSNELKELQELANETRENVIKMVYTAQSGHIGGALSATDILTVLYHKVMNIDPSRDAKRDRFVLSKGHASAALYSVLSQKGFFPKEDLANFRQFGSYLQGHPTLLCPGVEVATGSLGQGLSMACGIALALRLDKNPAKVFCLMGDGELQEGSVWEAFMNAPQRDLDNIVAIIDRNRLQIDGCTETIKSIDPLDAKLKAFNWEVVEIDGHDLSAINDALEKGKTAKKPYAIIANTVKGKGVSFMENNAGWHGTAPGKEDYEKAIAELSVLKG